VTLTDGAFSGTPVTLVTGAAGTITVKFEATGPETEAISTVLVPAADLDIAGTTANKYTVNGVTATQAGWEAAVASAVVNGGTVSVTKVGTALVWNIAS